jgi:HEAT repeat protein
MRTPREALAQHGIGSDKQSLLDALKNRDAEVRSLAAMTLGERDFDAVRADSIPALAEALRNETDPAAAAAMAVVLGGLGDFRGDRALEKMCHDSTIGSRAKLQAARYSLGLNSGNCLDGVLDHAFKGDDLATEEALGLLPQFQRLQHISSEDQDRIVAMVRRGLTDPSPQMRRSAAYARGSMSDESAAADLQRAINVESDAHVRDSMRTALISLQKQTSK